MSFLQVKGLSHQYEGKGEKTFNELSFDLGKSEILAILGASGSGKSTLLRCLAGFEKPESGEVILNNQKMVSKDIFVPPEKRGVGVVPQNFALFPHLSLEKNIAFGLHKLSAQERELRVSEMLEVTRITACKNSLPHEVSGGQQQRAALARALAPRPQLLLLDEPFAHLDDSLRLKIQEDLKILLGKSQMTVVLVTHSQQDVKALADQIIHFKA